MPYIPPEARRALAEVTRDIETIGELNYMITVGLLEVPFHELDEYIRIVIATYLIGKSPSYPLYNSVVGACMCALLEYSRRTNGDRYDLTTLMSDVISSFYAHIVAPYEDEKIAKNGDIAGYAILPTLKEVAPEDPECSVSI